MQYERQDREANRRLGETAWQRVLAGGSSRITRLHKAVRGRRGARRIGSNSRGRVQRSPGSTDAAALSNQARPILIKEGRSYLNQRLEDPELKPETKTSIAAWLGHAWQLRELREAKLVENDVDWIQLASTLTTILLGENSLIRACG